MTLILYYRGPLGSCNYDCGYCPFAKHVSPPAELEADRAALERFVAWVRDQTHRELHILFTPWGEALVRRWYRDALVALSRLDQVRRVAVQTNLSCGLSWLSKGRPARLALWVTYHPSEVGYDAFMRRLRGLDALGVPYSVGVVGVRAHFSSIARLRRDLPSSVYLWVNAYKSEGLGYYRATERAFLASIDPEFPLNARRHPSKGRPCQAGLTALRVDGAGTVYRCHFVHEPLGNLYESDLDALLRPRACPNDTCGCFIGYVHLDHLGQRAVYGDGLAPRIPRAWS